ncbi:MAG: 3-phosphoshikimate 1-carboxyvinyltransferase [Firmicutes bacterium]|nr:3-phosphoshikimate 1-carboxyvinyltransferase [[Eubacterium] siraeum]MCM1487238.1 3-phosphoshikimate 1-carboxyvinyltransferase [Bacillota bacterium]
MGKNIEITPSLLSGRLVVPPSKSISHRALICAALAKGKSEIVNLLDCADTNATAEVLKALGAKITKKGNITAVYGIENPNGNIIADCCESGSTLRFLIPVAAALGCSAQFDGRGKLPERPITPYFTELEKNGIIFEAKKMPYKISGQLKSGEFSLAGDISSQFITGLLLALPLLKGDSEISITSTLQSKPYVNITIDELKRFGIEVEETQRGYYVKGGQAYKPCNTEIEADMSQAAFFVAANALGSDIEIKGLNPKSLQGDRAILDIVKESKGNAFNVDASQIPDLVPILTVLATFSKGISHITNCGRLRIKECDRMAAISAELNKLGAKITENHDNLIIEGVDNIHGGECETYNDHRISMSLAIASTRATEPVILKNAECVSKSYPDFFEDFRSIGGKANVIND